MAEHAEARAHTGSAHLNSALNPSSPTRPATHHQRPPLRGVNVSQRQRRQRSLARLKGCAPLSMRRAYLHRLPRVRVVQPQQAVLACRWFKADISGQSAAPSVENREHAQRKHSSQPNKGGATDLHCGCGGPAPGSAHSSRGRRARRPHRAASQEHGALS